MKKQKNSRPAGTETAEKTVVCKKQTEPYQYYTTKRSKKQAFFLATIVVAVLLVLGLCFSKKTERLAPIEHKVRSGETLDEIALQYYDTTDDIIWQEYRAWVHEHNECGKLYPGDTVIVGVAS